MNFAQHVLGLFEELEPINEYVKKVGNQWCVLSHKTDKSLGCYPTEGQAKKRLKQIQYFKYKG